MIPLILAAVLASPGFCEADFDRNGATDVLDWLAFHSAWQVRDLRADFDKDGRITDLDALAYIEAWFWCIE